MFYENLKSLCNKRGTSPTAVAEAAGMSRSNVTEWKKGNGPRLETVLKIADELGVSPASLVRRKDTQEELQKGRGESE